VKLMSIGEKLKKLRGGKKSKDVAKAIGITISALSNYENDYRIPRDETKRKIAKYYKKSVEEIFFKN
jgi:transcriptional regulator